jgi:hypothetical protein
MSQLECLWQFCADPAPDWIAMFMAQQRFSPSTPFESWQAELPFEEPKSLCNLHS